MHALTLLLVATLQFVTSFKITKFHVPNVVPPDQDSVELECAYEANFTILNWFKGSKEFFRYKPASTPSTTSFPIAGVGSVEMIVCGPSECRLKLGHLTEQASGVYRCDLELDKPPHKFETRSGHMKVLRPARRKPVVEGLAEEYGPYELIQAYCRAEDDAQIRWYVNGKEILHLRGSHSFKMLSERELFQGLSKPTVTVQCAELIYGQLIGAKEAHASWREIIVKKQKPIDKSCVENRSVSIKQYFNLTYIIMFVIVSFWFS